jgi:biopolymer transport protein TolQ
MGATGTTIMHTTVIDMITNAGATTKLALGILALFSVIAWGIMIGKLLSYRNARRESHSFLQMFVKHKSLDDIYNASKKLKGSPMARVFHAGYVEFESEFRVASKGEETVDTRFFLDKIDGIARSLERAIAQELTNLERYLFFLATTGSTAPFIGLFGTVWGIMESFRAIGVSGAANIAIVAPGIAEALIATAAGLVTAIPAVIGYNYFSHRVKVFGTEMDNFSLDFLSLIEKNFVKRT